MFGFLATLRERKENKLTSISRELKVLISISLPAATIYFLEFSNSCSMHSIQDLYLHSLRKTGWGICISFSPNQNPWKWYITHKKCHIVLRKKKIEFDEHYYTSTNHTLISWHWKLSRKKIFEEGQINVIAKIPVFWNRLVDTHWFSVQPLYALVSICIKLYTWNTYILE